MKLTVDLSGLLDAVKQMGAEIQPFDLFVEQSEFEGVDGELSSAVGIEIDFTEIESDSGVLSYKGRQVLLFIPDQGHAIDTVLDNPEKGRKYHVADCQTLDTMKKRNRFDRYKVTNNLEGKFSVYGISELTGKERSGEAALTVCKNCLKYLNYQGYNSGGRKGTIFANFNISHFLSHYSTLFSAMPERHFFIAKSSYSDDWSEISASFRAGKNYCCQQCNVNLSDHKHLLHTHHVNGNKRDNRSDNLEALCIDCHRKQPMHDYMRVKRSDMMQINELREAQGVLRTGSWEAALAMADTSVHGVLLHYKESGEKAPEVAYQIRLSNGNTVRVEAAWPSKRFALVLDETTEKLLTNVGWSVSTVGAALRSEAWM